MDKYTDKAEKRLNFDKALYTKVVWAGRRRYYFDILATRGGDKYISITESKKRAEGDERPQFNNQKIFLFKEDFTKFSDALNDVLQQLDQTAPVSNPVDLNQLAIEEEIEAKEESLYNADDVDFDSL